MAAVVDFSCFDPSVKICMWLLYFLFIVARVTALILSLLSSLFVVSSSVVSILHKGLSHEGALGI